MGISLVGIAGKILNSIPEIDYKLVSTDSKEIALEAINYGLEAPFTRPPELSGDRVGDIPVLKHALNWYQKNQDEDIDVILMIQPTSPMRKINHINECLNKLILGKFDSVITISKTNLKYHPYKQLVTNKENLKWFDQSIGDKIVTRQDLLPTYHKNGACYAIDSSFKIELLNEVLASKEMYLARFYFEKEKWVPAINRFKLVVEKYDQTIFVEEALHRLVEIHYKIGLEDEAKKYAYVLGYNYQSSQWYENTYKVFNKNYTKPITKIKNQKSLIERIKSKLF